MSEYISQYNGSFWIRMRRRLLRSLISPLLSMICSFRIEGKENIPPDGTSYFLAYNHKSHFEPPFILAKWPYMIEALAGADVWDRPWVGGFVAVYKAIPVHRGDYDRKTVEIMLDLMSAGRPVMMAPEGGRSGDAGMRRALPGIAYLVDRAQAPILPIVLEGTYNAMLKQVLKGNRPEVVMRVGELFTTPPLEGRGAERRASRQKNADFVMLRLAEMLPVEYHGEYAGMVGSSENLQE